MKKIDDGIYIVADPAPGLEQVLPKIEKALAGGLAAIQLWNHWQSGQDKPAFAKAVCAAAAPYRVPVLIHEDWSLLAETPLDGVHFDALPDNLPDIRVAVGRPFLCGITCGNDLEQVRRADEQGIDYVSFCSMFASVSAGACTIVSPETVKEARQLTTMSIFVAGGITPLNIGSLADTGINGVALVSAIMKSDDPERTVRLFREKLPPGIHHTQSQHP